MKTTFLKVLPFILLIGFFAVSSCEKPDPDGQSAEDDARGSYIMADAFAIGNNQAGSGKAYLPDCVDVYKNGIDSVILTFDNCDYNGAVRNGKIIIKYTLRTGIGDRAADIIVAFENYTFNNIQVEGTITTTFGGTYIIPEIHVLASNMLAVFPDSKRISWSSDKTFKITEGFGDGDISTNVIEISGTASGVNRNGLSYSATYSAVTVDRSCEYGYPVSGTVTIISDKGTSVIDYGNGSCDNTITVTNNGVSVSLTLN